MEHQSTKAQDAKDKCGFCCCFLIAFFSLPLVIWVSILVRNRANPNPDIELVSMDVIMFNVTQTHLDAKWDLSIRIPSYLPDKYICLQGDLETSILYKNSTLATSTQKYNDLKHGTPQLLKISVNVSEKNISDLIGNEIIKDIEESKEVKFESQFFLTDCRKGTTKMMRYVCDEVTLRFEVGSDMNATMVGNHPRCINV